MRRLILDKYGREFVRSICECTQNVLNGNVPITGNQKRSLSRFKWDLRELAENRVSDKEKTKILKKGGFLGCLLTPVVSLWLCSPGLTRIGRLTPSPACRRRRLRWSPCEWDTLLTLAYGAGHPASVISSQTNPTDSYLNSPANPV